jgi:hypothetical protein
MNATHHTPDHAPTLIEIQSLSDLCSPKEWEWLITSHGFLEAIAGSLEKTEAFMTARLGRKISVGGLSVKNPGDETL